MNLRVNVSRQAINQGVCQDAAKCAVALAVKRAVQRKLRRRTIDVAVCGCITIALDTGRSYRSACPKRVSNFIDKFDRADLPSAPANARQELKPFTFNLRLR